MRSGQTQIDRQNEIFLGNQRRFSKKMKRFLMVFVPLQFLAAAVITSVIASLWPGNPPLLSAIVCVLVVLSSVFFFFLLTHIGLGELMNSARHQAEAEYVLATMELTVETCTRQLMDSHGTVAEQQASLISMAKLSALSEMSGGIAHEINTPLAVIGLTAETLHERVVDGSLNNEDLTDSLSVIIRTVQRISKIITGLRHFSGNKDNTQFKPVKMMTMIEDALIFCNERFKNKNINLEFDRTNNNRLSEIECRSVEISQVLLSLLTNSFDAVLDLSEKWVRLEVVDLNEHIEVLVTDSGRGIPQEIQGKIMQPFFTTKAIGQGTGLGLSISSGIVQAHHGKLYLDTNHPRTRFVLRLPKKQPQNMSKNSAA